MYADHPPRLSGHWSDPEAFDIAPASFVLSTDSDRLTHLVLVDGRLVEAWSESVAGTRWQHHAERFDRERRPASAAPPSPPLHERVLTWLDAAVGGRSALLTMHAEALVDDGFEPAPDLAPGRREHLATVIDLLDRAAVELRVPEARALLTNTLRAAWSTDPDSVLELGGPTRLAAGICWVAARANGLVGAGGTTTQSALQHAVDCRTPISGPGRVVHRLVAGYWPDPTRPIPMPDLLLVGRTELLVSSTRRHLVRAREQALRAQAVAGSAGQEATITQT